MLHPEDDQPSPVVGNERTKRCAFTNFLSQLFGLGGGTGTGVPPINVGLTGGSGLGLTGDSGLGLTGGSGFGMSGGSAFGLTGGSGNGIPPLNVGGSGVGLDRTSNFESGGGGSAVFIDRRFRESSRRAKIRRGHRVEDAYDESESHMD
ncbi:hypothetical protein Ddc_19041 [Ditylenchus destructor]|nr:hypothetical protein Ddc_19041 [Ditylenchus destructor]